MSALNGFSPLPPLYAPMSPLTRSTSFDWNVLVRCQSAASAALENPNEQQTGDLLAAAVVQQPDSAPMAQAEEAPQEVEVKDEPIDGGEACSRTRRKKRKPAPPPSSDDDSAPKTKLERNRESARRYRESKKLHLTKLESENESLKQKVKSLTKLLNASQAKVVKLTQQVTELNEALRRQKEMGFAQYSAPPL